MRLGIGNTLKIIFYLLCFYDPLAYLIAQTSMHEYSDSVISNIIKSKVHNNLKTKGLTLYDDTLFERPLDVMDEFGKNKNWEYDFNGIYRDAIDIFDSSYLSFYRFAFRYTRDTNLMNQDFTIDGFIYGEKLFVNQRKFCLQELGGHIEPKRFSESNFDSILYMLKIKYGIKSCLDMKHPEFQYYKMRIPDFSKDNKYKLSYEILPKNGVFDGELYKNTGNSIVSKKEYVEIEKCNCNDYELVTLIRNWGVIKDSKSENYKSFPVQYLLIKNKGFEIIEKGTFSFEKEILYKN